MSNSTVMFSRGLGQYISSRKEKVSTGFILFIQQGSNNLIEGIAKRRERKVVPLFLLT